jgi:hypothetical protein
MGEFSMTLADSTSPGVSRGDEAGSAAHVPEQASKAVMVKDKFFLENMKPPESLGYVPKNSF